MNAEPDGDWCKGAGDSERASDSPDAKGSKAPGENGHGGHSGAAGDPMTVKRRGRGDILKFSRRLTLCLAGENSYRVRSV